MSRLPATRAECAGGARPCLHVSCRHHLLLDVIEGGLAANRVGRTGLRSGARTDEADAWTDQAAAVLVAMPETCALDVAERGGATLDEVGGLLGVTRERARQIADKALARALRIMRDWGER